ncbi:type II toxin-antitoxin system HicB family antitoxin [Halomonas aquamarina]|uniref:Type II toxin-antitoxin system HicB family antitoxin n=1 Tax=Vreelandella aquamarina TaxID=77097 RepID=A0ACC5VY66_9GAMM|nr:type II toxin-antitoxin system HicB family antitoxin [Halomonas aquamarina]
MCYLTADFSPYLPFCYSLFLETPDNAEKVNVTLPGHVIRQIDKYVTTHGIKSRSVFIASAALEKLTHA